MAPHDMTVYCIPEQYKCFNEVALFREQKEVLLDKTLIVVKQLLCGRLKDEEKEDKEREEVDKVEEWEEKDEEEMEEVEQDKMGWRRKDFTQSG